MLRIGQFVVGCVTDLVKITLVAAGRAALIIALYYLMAVMLWVIVKVIIESGL